MIYPTQGPTGYRELADLLRHEIHSGRYARGQRLPSEGALAQTYGVASKTARAAIQQMRDEGLAAYVRGYGVVVREAVEPEVITVPFGSQVGGRTPTPQERSDYGVPEGWPLLVVWLPDGLIDSYSAHRYRIEIEREAAPE